MRCARCSFENPPGKKFCGGCGNALNLTCARCGSDNPPDFRFCADCGAALAPDASKPRVNKQPPQPVRVAPEQAEVSPAEGERKTVTALFADIKGSMELIEDLDPEEARAIVDPALTLMMEAVHRYDGYVAQSTGDGIFALFGAPVAHEDHPQRALYAALRMQEAIKRYAERLRADKGVNLQVRVGANTGEVVVRSIQTGEAHTEYAPIGHSTSLAARLQALAAPGSIAISDTVRKLVEGYFTLKPLGPARIKGVSEPVHVYEVTGLGALRTRLHRAAHRGLSKFVGREAEMQQLRRALELVTTGHGQIAAAVGEAGVGKSRLFYEFKAIARGAGSGGLAPGGIALVEAFSVSHGKASAYLPVIELLAEYFEIRPEDEPRRRREKVAGRVLMLDRALEDTLPYLFALLGIIDGEDPLAQMDAQVKRRRTQEAVKRLLLRESLTQPVVVVFEDLHWVDDETQAVLGLLADAIATARVLLLVNYRPEYRHDWGNRTYYTQLRLDPLGPESAAEMLTALLGPSSPPPDQGEGKGEALGALTRLISEKTQGNPFFMEEMVQALFEEGALVRDGTVKLVTPLDQIRIPTTVQAVLTSRIDRLPAEEKALLQTLAVIGNEFPERLVQQVAGVPEDALRKMLTDLQAAEFIYEQPAAEVEYIFKHALTHDAAYHSVLSERRTRLHARTAQAIEDLFRYTLDAHYAELAHHYSRTDNAAKAVEYLRLAGIQAAGRGAYEEAIAQLSRGLKLVPELPEGAEREQQELMLQLALGPALRVTKGFTATEVENAFGRAVELCTRVGEGLQLWHALFGLFVPFVQRADLQRAGGLAEQLLQSARPSDDAWGLFMGHHALSVTLYWQGELRKAREHVQQAFDLGAPLRQRLHTLPHETLEQLVFNRGYRAQALLALGYPDQAVRASRENVALAQEFGRLSAAPAVALYWDGELHRILGDVEVVRERAEALVVLATEHGFSEYMEWGILLRGCALADGGQIEAGITELRSGIEAKRASDSWLAWPHYAGILAAAYGRAGQPAQGLALIEDAVECMNRTGQHVSESDLHRIKGDLLLAVSRDTQGEAEDCFCHAVDCARRQSAKSMELAAALSLSRLWHGQGKHDDARKLLAEIHGWFTEGFETRDLRAAKVLLDELSLER